LDFVVKANHFDNQIYNVLTTNVTVQEIVDLIQVHIPGVEVSLVDSQIMNQLSYIVSNEKFKQLGFDYQGKLTQGIADTIQLIRGVCQSHPAKETSSAVRMWQ
jgi:nucleoside-diphosphate-sugar epimerase